MNKNKLKSRNQKIIIDQDSRITALKKQMVYYKEITETIREPFVILDKNFRVVSANPAFYRTFKVNKADTAGKCIYDLGNGQWDNPKLRQLLEYILPARQIMNDYELTHVFPKVGRKTVLLNARQVDHKNLILLAIEDITLHKKLANDTGEMNTRLTEQRDLLQGLVNTKDEFVSLASHQLRTPATVVKQYIGMTIDGFAGILTTAQRKLLSVAYRNNERQLEIIDDLLRVARVDDGKVYLDKTLCNIVQLVQSTIHDQAVLFKDRGQTVKLRKSKKELFALIDYKLIIMVIENLLDNAGKYSPEGTVVKINITQDKKSSSIAFTDSGVGIRKSDFKNLFKKFSRIDNPMTISVQGTGLGLYWSKKVLDLHGGSIDVNSKIHHGSTFTIIIPTLS